MFGSWCQVRNIVHSVLSIDRRFDRDVGQMSAILIVVSMKNPRILSIYNTIILMRICIRSSRKSHILTKKKRFCSLPCFRAGMMLKGVQPGTSPGAITSTKFLDPPKTAARSTDDVFSSLDTIETCSSGPR
jgi:hypothetical protein